MTCSGFSCYSLKENADCFFCKDKSNKCEFPSVAQIKTLPCSDDDLAPAGKSASKANYSGIICYACSYTDFNATYS